MIITETVSSPVITSIQSTPSRFKIKASAKAFKILSGFYSEPILAIPRELGANAWDAHVKAGNTKTMFEVHAPNQLEPWFSIRDFGTGLSREDVDTIYTTYFESTKTSDNDSDGCMGLGSKTPFNYTENFTVTSWFNGVKYVYNCFIDEAGSPNIMHVAEEATKEHNGLEIKFGVKMNDISMFIDKITRAFEPFRFRPVIKGANITYPERKYIYNGKNWACRDGSSDRHDSGCKAFMGNYCYPVSSNALRSALHNMQLPSGEDRYRLETLLSQGRVDFFFNIGDLEVAPNKEQLQYDDNNRTVSAIINAARVAYKELVEMVQKNVEVPKTRWEAMQLYTKYNGYNSPYSFLRNIIGDIHVNFNGVRITHSGEGMSAVNKNAGLVSTSGDQPKLELFSMDSIGGRIKRCSSLYSPENGKYLIFHTSAPGIKKARVRHYLKTHFGNGTTTLPTVYILIDHTAGAVATPAYQTYFGWNSSNVLEIESLPKPPPTPRAKRVLNTDEIYYTDISEFIKPTQSRSSYYRPGVNWGRKSETVDSTGVYYYVDFYYTDPRWNNKNISEFMDKIVRIFVDKKLNNGVTTIYGINVKNKRLLKVGKWINVAELVKKELRAEKHLHEDMLHRIKVKQDFDSVHDIYSKLTRSPSVVTNIKNSDTRNTFQAFMKTYSELVKLVSEIDVNFYSTFGISAKKHTDLGIDVGDFKKLLKDKYMGVIGLLGNDYYGENAAVYKIINFIDEKS